MPDSSLTIAGNLTGEPELRFTGSGRAVCNFTVAVNHRYQATNGEWMDGEPTFQRCIAWAALAENLAASARKGTRVTVIGHLQSRSYETNSGESRTVVELNAAEIGLSLRFSRFEPGERTSGRAAQPQPDRAQRSAPAAWQQADPIYGDEEPF